MDKLSSHFLTLRRMPLAAIIAIFACLAGPAAVAARAADAQAPSAPPTAEQKSLLTQMQDAFTSIAKTSEPFVVNITAEHPLTAMDELDEPPIAPQGPDLHSPHHAPGGSDPFPRQAEATGSGVIVRPDGYILTNDHVVDGSQYVTVTLSDGREFRGRVYPDFTSDLAIVKIDPGNTPLTAATFGDSDQVLPGQWAIAIGSPFDLQNTMTVGVISATNRHQLIGDDPASARYYPDLLQTDAAINPGNSGGPLLNIDGKVIGINVAIESPVEGSAGVGFAIPSQIAERVMNDLIENGKVVRGYLGLAPSDLTPALEQQTGVNKGAFVDQVDEDSPAGRAGIHAADVITAYDGQPVDGELSLREAIADTTPGQSVAISVVRDGQPLVVDAKITTPPAGAAGDAPPADQGPAPKTVGISVRALTASDRSQLGFDPALTGAIVTNVDPNSPAANTEPEGLEQNDVIEQVGEAKITTPAECIHALSNLAPGSQTTLRVMRSDGGKLQELALDLDVDD